MIKQERAFNYGKKTERVTFCLDPDTLTKLNNIKKDEEKRKNNTVSLSYIIVKTLRESPNIASQKVEN